jgi:hypothetical protein
MTCLPAFALVAAAEIVGAGKRLPKAEGSFAVITISRPGNEDWRSTEVDLLAAGYS